MTCVVSTLYLGLCGLGTCAQANGGRKLNKGIFVAESTEKELCGIVMPISKCDGLPADHWKEVLNIIKSVADKDGFDLRCEWSKS